MKKARSWMVTLLLAAFTVRVLWWTISPLIPYLISGLVVVVVMGFIYHRMTRW